MSVTGEMTASGSESFAAQFRARREALPGGELAWLGRLREGAIASFAERGLPTPRSEAWKYTNLRALEKLPFAPATPEASAISVDRVPSLLPAESRHPRLVFVNGFLRADLSRVEGLPAGVAFGGLAQSLGERPELVESALSESVEDTEDGDAPLLALNAALMEDGAVLRVGAGIALEEPLELVFLGAAQASPLAYHPRLLVRLEENSQATLLESHTSLGEEATVANQVTAIDLRQGARLHHVKLQDENDRAFHLASLRASLARDATYEGFGLTLGAGLSRNEAGIRLEGSGGHCRLGGGYLLRGAQHCDNTTVIEHLAPHTSCREVFKGALDGRSRGVFQGKIVVHKDAQQTDGHQLSKALLLSEGAEIDAKPELEIYADDVKCSHGATAGEIDHDALFYLRSRGVPEARARGLLIEAFLAEAVEESVAEPLRAPLLARISEWLAAETGADGD